MLIEQSLRQQILQGCLVAVLAVLIVNLWFARTAQEHQTFYSSQSQAIMHEALETETQVQAFSHQKITSEQMRSTQEKFEALLTGLRAKIEQSERDGWNHSAREQLQVLQGAWDAEKKNIESIRLKKDIHESESKIISQVLKQSLALDNVFADIARRNSPSADKVQPIRQHISHWRSLMNGSPSKINEAMYGKSWDAIRLRVNAFFPTAAQVKSGSKTEEILNDYKELINSVNEMRSQYIATKHLTLNVQAHDSPLFTEASKMAVSLGKKPRDLIGSIYLSMVMVFILMILIGVLQRYHGKIDDKLVLALTKDQDEMENSIKLFVHEASNLADGNLNVEFTVTPGPTEALAETMNRGVKALDQMIRSIIYKVQNLQKDMSLAHEKTDRVEKAFRREKEVLETTLNKMKGVSNVLERSSKTSGGVVTSAEKTVKNAHESVTRIRGSLSQVGKMAERMVELRTLISNLNRHNEHIQESVGMVEDASEQTVILALNAAIQAAMAGEGGQGFSIVATEMQELADQIEDAMKKILMHLGALSGGVQTVMNAISDTSDIIEGEVLITKEGSQSLAEIEAAAGSLEQILLGVTNASHIESEHAEDIASSGKAIHDSMESLSAAIKEVRETLHDLTVNSNGLSDDINTFVLWEDNHAK